METVHVIQSDNSNWINIEDKFLFDGAEVEAYVVDEYTVAVHFKSGNVVQYPLTEEMRKHMDDL